MIRCYLLKEVIATDRKTEEKTPRQGVRLRTVNMISLIVVTVLVIALFFSMLGNTLHTMNMRRNTEWYLSCSQSATDMQQGSDYLTAEARAFVATGDVVHAQNYCTEAAVTRRREQAQENLAAYTDDDDLLNVLDEARRLSDRLMEQEIYAMRLTYASIGTPDDEIPFYIRQVPLRANDAALSAEEQSAMATDMMFGGVYKESKAQVDRTVSAFAGKVLQRMKQIQQDDYDRSNVLLSLQKILIAVLLAVAALVVALMARLVLSPLAHSADYIIRNQRIPVQGAREMRLLADSYNRMFDENHRRTARLSYQASHDPLTGVSNRADFESILNDPVPPGNVALLLVDVDKFKYVNDRYGHEVGDLILKSVAEVLKSSFRADDGICRIGGDEFVVILYQVVADNRSMIERKVGQIAQRLKHPTDGLPVQTLSIGAAFGTDESSMKSLYKMADLALYQAKDDGRDCLRFYDPAVHGDVTDDGDGTADRSKEDA